MTGVFKKIECLFKPLVSEVSTNSRSRSNSFPDHFLSKMSNIKSKVEFYLCQITNTWDSYKNNLPTSPAEQVIFSENQKQIIHCYTDSASDLFATIDIDGDVEDESYDFMCYMEALTSIDKFREHCLEQHSDFSDDEEEVRHAMAEVETWSTQELIMMHMNCLNQFHKIIRSDLIKLIFLQRAVNDV